MRSVKQERTRRHDARRVRASSRAARSVSSRAPFGKRRRNDLLSRLIERGQRWFAFGHPMLWFSGSLLMLVAAIGLFAGGFVHKAVAGGERALDNVAENAGFGITSIKLDGNHRTQASDILAALAYRPGQPIFFADARAARNRILSLAWVRDAEVRLVYPDTISVDIVERIPFALWQTSDLLYVVERSGRAITVARPLQYQHLPLLLGDGAPQASADLIDAIASRRAVAARVKAMQRVSARRWNLILDGDVLVQLPEDGWLAQLDLLERLIVDKGVLERDVSEIDLREKDNYFFILRNGQKLPSVRGNAA